MVRLREVPRTAAFAWSPGPALPFIATGTRAGAVDVDFSNETCLEIWDLALDREISGSELEPAAKISTDSGFHDLAWTNSDDSSRGVIAGALENGSLDLWNVDCLLNGASNAHISRASKHSGPIKTLQFNPRHSNLLATGGGKGELFISDLNNIDHPFRLGNTAARPDDIECLDWNKRVAHILVTGSSAGFVTVWDVKTKKESLTLNNLGRKAVSAVAWDPEKPTKLITSIPLESDPLILVWDLRNSNAPERVLKGHESGVLSLSWCAQDSDLLLSCGKDNRTICWNPQTGQPYGEFPVVTNWTFQTRWNPHNPHIFATASFDGKISVQTIQNTRNDVAQAGENQSQSLDDEDFFAKAQTQPPVSTFSLPKAPRWLERPTTASFGFGGRVISVSLTEPMKGGCRSSKVRISQFEVDSSVGSASETFESALKTGDLRTICKSRVTTAHSEDEKADWKVIETLVSDNPRKQLVDYLGFSNEVDEAADGLSRLGLSKQETNGVAETDISGSGPKRHKRLSSIFDANADGDSFLIDLAASKGAKTNDPFRIYTGSESEADRGITRSVLLGQFERALDICLQEDRMSDAFMIAICGGQKCIDKVQEAYFSKQSEGPNYLRLLASVVGKNLWDVVHNADLSNWKEAMATICSYANNKEFPDLCEALGDRLEEHSKTQNDREAQRDACFCYMASSKLEKVVSIWIDELKKSENSNIQEAADDTSFSIHVRALQSLIEKVTVFRHVTRFEDPERQKQSDWKLASLYEKYIEYADVIATHGRLEVAERYLNLLPANHPEGSVARNRIKLATRKAELKAAQTPAVSSTRQATKLPPTRPSFPSAPSQTANPYAPPATVQGANPYASVNSGTGYTPGGYQLQQGRSSSVAPPPQPFAPPLSGSGPPPPPRGLNQSPSRVTSYTQATNLPAWNDLPQGFTKAPTPRRGTPSAPASVISTPFPHQQGLGNQVSRPDSPHQAGIPRQRTPVAPPPKGPGAPPRMVPPLSTGPPQGFHAPERPPSTSNPYYAVQAASPVTHGMNVPIPRGASPYNAPPSGPPPTNRYTPNPTVQPTGLQPHPRPQMTQPPHANPPQSSAIPPYGSQHFQQSPQSAPPQESRPSTGQSQKKAPAASKYPPGDRSHIPPNAQPIFEILAADMQRVKARAPASFKAKVNDTERRLSILFDHLNNEDLLKPNTIQSMVELAQAMQERDYDVAHALHLDILTNQTEECGNWMVGVKRLISMSRATP